MSATTTVVTGGTEPRDVAPVRRGFDWGQPFVYLVALVIAAIAVGPVIYVFMGGLRTTADLNANPAGLPDPWTLENWIAVLSAPRFWGNVFASTVLVFADVIDDFILVRYLSGDSTTEPVSVKVYNTARAAPTPALNALTTVLLVASLLTVLIGFLIYRRLTRGERSTRSIDVFAGEA